MVVATLFAFTSLTANAEELICRRRDPREILFMVEETYADRTVRQITREIRPYVEVPVCLVSVPVLCPDGYRGPLWTELVVPCELYPAGMRVDVIVTHCKYEVLPRPISGCVSQVGKFEIVPKEQ